MRKLEWIVLELTDDSEFVGTLVNVTITPSLAAYQRSFQLNPAQQKTWKSLVAAQFAPMRDIRFLILRTVNLVAGPIQVVLHTEDDIVMRITLRRKDGQPSQPTDQKLIDVILRAIDKHAPIQTRAALLHEALPAAHREQLAYQQQILAKLQATTESITAGLADFTLKANADLRSRQSELEASFRTRQDALEADFRARQDALEADVRQRQAELDTLYQTKENELRLSISAREEAVSQREQEVQTQKAELDLRDATAARRANQKQIQQIIEAQSKIKLTADTAKKRGLVHTLCLLGLLAFGGLAGTFLYMIVSASDTSFHWQYALPFSTGLIGFASTLVYWIKWSDDWFREHARAEFANRKFNADATRAAWLVELLLEWSKEGREAMPPAVIESLTKNLFTETASEAPTHASDVLQRFVSRLANVRIDSAGVELGTSSGAKPTKS